MKNIVLFAVILFGLVACGRSSDAPSQWQDSTGILRFIPASSPLVAVQLAPFPESFRQRFVAQNALIDRASRDAWSRMIEDVRSAGDSESPSLELFEALQRLNRLTTEEGAGEAGLSPDAQRAFYWVSAQPVFRIALADHAAFERFVDKFQQDLRLTDAELEGQRYRYLSYEGARIALLVNEEYAVVTLAPTSVADEALREQLGISLPASNIAEAGVLAELAQTHGFTGGQMAYLQPTGLFDAITGIDGMISQLAPASMVGAEPLASPLSDVCREDMQRWQSVVEALTLGYSDAGASGLKGAVAVDLESSFAKSLVGLAEPVPGLGVPTDALMSFGLSLDVETLRKFVEQRVASILAAPYKCPQMMDLNDQAQRLQQVLERQPTPPTARDFRGFSVFLERPASAPQSALDALQTLQASWILSMKNPEALVAFGNLFVPQISALNLKPDGKPVVVPQGLLNPTGQTMQLAMTDDRLMGVLGSDGEARLSELRSLPANNDSPIVALDVDTGAYIDLYGDQIGSSSVADPMLLDTLNSLYDRQSLSLRTSKNGLRLDFEITLKEENK